MVPSRLLSQYCLPERCPTSTRSTSAIRCASASICKVMKCTMAGHDGLADGQVLRMDTSVITALAALAGAAIGGLTSVVASWLTQRSQAREQRLAHYQLRRQNIYKEFIELASKLYIHALQNDKRDVSALMGLYAEIAKIRALSSASVVDSADQIIKKASSRSRMGHFWPISISCLLFCRCGHVGNALALSIMSTATLRAHVVEWSTRPCLARQSSR